MTTTAHLNPSIDIGPPPGSGFVDTWEAGGGDRRVVLGIKHTVTDCDVTVSTSCIQYLDGRIDDGSGDECPRMYIDQSVELNSDQARELAALLLELAKQIDGWVAR
ncbi:MAG TPA: hypothetical protein VI029_18115 [Mycobacterium sp.]